MTQIITQAINDSLIIAHHLNNDLLNSIEHSNSEVLKAVENLKIDLKAPEKTFIENYGVIIGALIGAGLGIVGSIVNFYLNTKSNKNIKEQDEQKKYDEFKMNLCAELTELNNELFELVKIRDYAHMDYNDEFYKLKANDIKKRREGIEIDCDKLEKKYKELENQVTFLKNRLVKQISFYLYKKNYKTVVTEHQMEFLSKGLRYHPELFQGSEEGIVGEIKFFEIRRKNYKSFHIEHIVFPLSKILVAIRNDE